MTSYHHQVSSCCFEMKIPPLNSAGITCRCPTPFLRCTPCKQQSYFETTPSFADSFASPARAVVMGIQELVENILVFLDDPLDLVNMACTAKRYTDMALRLAWDTPTFSQPPMMYMSRMFDVDQVELEDSALVSSARLARFDYYARFIRHIRLGQLEPEVALSRALVSSRQEEWLFPFLKSIHVGVEGAEIGLIRPYLSPSIRSVCVDHWDTDDPFEVRACEEVTSTLLDILRLPCLEFLDLMDTRYIAYETHAEVMEAFANLLPRLRGFFSYDFTTLSRLFVRLSESTNLRELFLDLSDEKDLHVPLETVIDHLRTAFIPLSKLVLLSSGQTAAYLLNTVQRRLQSIDLRIEGSMNADGLRGIISSLASSVPTLTAFRCTSSQSGWQEPETALLAALQPLKQLTRLAHLHVTVSFSREEMLSDVDLAQFFACWPDLQSFCLESDPDEGPMPIEEEEEGRGLTLNCVLRLPQCAPRLRDISLSYVDARVVPDLTAVEHFRSSVPLTLHFSRSHVHDPDAAAEFLAGLWPAGRFSFDIFCRASRGVSTEDD